MSEVSVVTSLITRLIAVSLALGAAGTLVDQAFFMKSEAKSAVSHKGISYLKWNQTLVKRK